METQNIETDIEGIISELNLSESDVLYPFFETVVNSIQSINEEMGKLSGTAGEIYIYIERDKTDKALFEKSNNYPIKSIRIIDNGIGFNDSNFISFRRSHSTKKIKIGGKGLGRFTMLSVFNSMKVDSTYKNNEGKMMIRKFEFSRKPGLLKAVVSTTEKKELKTEILLENINSKFKTETVKYTHEAIADCILEHCLLYYLNKDVPTIRVIEDGIEINLSRQFNPTDFVKYTKTETVLSHKFTTYFVKNNKIKAHEYFLCGHNRKVKSRRIDSFFPIFTSKIIENNEDYWLQIYVVSKYLDERVNPSRNEINFPKMKDESFESSLGDFKEETRTVIVEKDIDELIKKLLLEKYDEIIGKRKEFLRDKLTVFFNSDEGLEYRTLDTDDNLLTTIPDIVDEKKLDDILHEYQYRKSKEIKKKRERLLSKDYSRKNDYQTLLKDVVTLITKEGNTRLAQYIAHRKTIINLLEKYLEWCEEKNNYKDEATLHNLIFVMGGTDSTIQYDSHNLWILDDRLAFHRYIYSDKAIKTHNPKKGKSNSKLETDIAIYDVYDKNYIYGEKNEYEEIASAVIFEFKRPDRNITYEEFSKQMREQIQAINEGKLIDKNQKHILTSSSTPIFFYYVCDVNAYNTLKKSATLEGFTETPYKSLMRLTNNTYQEILTYQILITNAKRRNKAFFKKLGIE